MRTPKHSAAVPGALAAGLALTLAIAGLLVASPAAAEEAAKEVFIAQKCNLCHAVSTAEIEAKTTSDKLKGPDLAKIEIERTPEQLVGFLKKQSMLDETEHKRDFKGTDEELAAIIDWLLEQQRAARAAGG